MRLVIIDEEGTVHEVVDELEAYDLNNQIARCDLVNDVRDELERLLALKKQ